MNPVVSAVNSTPRLTALLSPASTVAGVACPNIVHGQLDAAA